MPIYIFFVFDICSAFLLQILSVFVTFCLHIASYLSFLVFIKIQSLFLQEQITIYAFCIIKNQFYI